MNINEYCKLGEEADNYCFQDDFVKAEEIYYNILDNLIKDKEVDNFLISKTTLGLLLLYVKSDQREKAYKIWTADPAENIFGIGIMGLEETFQTSTYDSIIYLIICGYLYSIANEDPSEAAEAIEYYMEPVVNYSIKENNSILELAISNWKKYLIDVFNGFIPQKFTDKISEYETKIDKTIPILKIDFPHPSPWKIDWKAKEHKIGPDK